MEIRNYKNTLNKTKDADLFNFVYDDEFYRVNPELPDSYRGQLKNFHTHTYRCNHATGDVYDYCERAIERGFDTIGFTDHNPFPDNKPIRNIRMDFCELDDYIADINQARVDYPSLKLFTGFECDYFKEFDSYYRDFLLGEKKIEYLTGSVHVYPYNGELRGVHGQMMNTEMMKSYTKCLIDIIESGHFTYVNHPDLFGQQMKVWNDEVEAMSKYIIEAAIGNDLPLELNVSGICKVALHPDEADNLNYPIRQFWEMASDLGAEVVLGTDAHHPIRLDTNMYYGVKMIEELNLKQADIISRIESGIFD